MFLNINLLVLLLETSINFLGIYVQVSCFYLSGVFPYIRVLITWVTNVISVSSVNWDIPLINTMHLLKYIATFSVFSRSCTVRIYAPSWPVSVWGETRLSGKSELAETRAQSARCLDRTTREYQVTLASDLGQLQWNQLSLLS